jgi:hypothetical protein
VSVATSGPTLGDLWHAAGRAAVDSRKRLLALQGLAVSALALLVGSWLVGLVTLPARTVPLTRPAGYVLEPLRAAWLADRDGALVAWFVVEGLLLALVWGWFGGALARLAVVDLGGRGRERGPRATAFARRHIGALWGSSLMFSAALLVPAGLAWLVGLLAGLPGPAGAVLTPLVIVAVVVLSLAAIVGATLVAACAFLARPAVAADDGDMFDAFTRSITYAWGALPRLAAVRLFFFTGVLLGSGWRLLRTVLAALLATWLLEHALGAARFERLLTVIGARGAPEGASRMNLTVLEMVAAGALALCAAALVAAWLADLVSRIACARAAAYLVLRRAVDRVEIGHLATPPAEVRAQTAEEAGFDEVGRVGAP